MDEVVLSGIETNWRGSGHYAEAPIMALVAEVRRLIAERDAINTVLADLRRLRAEVEAQARELERWRHGVTIEGDYVCPNALAADLARDQEREACAAICDEAARMPDRHLSTVAADLADRIRARGDQ